MKRRWALALAGAMLLVAVAAYTWWQLGGEPARPPAPPAAAMPLPPAALARLARGVNLSEWLQHGRPTDAQRFAPDADDFRHLRALGLTHVRLPFDPQALVDDRGMPDAGALETLRATVQAASAEDLLTVLVLQLPDVAKAGLAGTSVNRVALAGHWRWLAGALRDVPPSHLAFEPLNEPGTEDAAASRELMGYLATELRGAAPAHTLVISGHRYSGIDELVALQPLGDPNLVYGFHFYEPHNFTHQGASWGDVAWKALRNFPYPSSPDSAAQRRDSVPAEARKLLEWHGEERWNRERIAQRLAHAERWSERYGVPVWCSEFGVLKGQVGSADRAAWLNDVRVELEQRGIPWTHWDYAGAFGIVGGTQGKRVPDDPAIEALGLKRD
jgi:endoglucanase